MAKKYIAESCFNLFKIGPGPSSSHTIGPMLAAADFRGRIAELPEEIKAQAAKVGVIFYGSLAATGRGHGSDRAVTAGLLGAEPTTVDPDWFNSLCTDKNTVYPVTVGKLTLSLPVAAIEFSGEQLDFYHPNTMCLELRDRTGLMLHRELYYSIGGGAIEREGDTPHPPPKPPYCYHNWNTFTQLLDQYQLPPTTILRHNEMIISNCNEAEVDAKLDRIIDAMLTSVERGLATEGILPGPIKLARRAATVLRAANANFTIGQQAARLNAYALAAAEENAAGHIIVTAPTAGSAGVVAALVYALHENGVERARLRDSLLIAALVGMVVRHNGSISGAEVGCQGEIGVASAMAAAMMATVRNLSWGQIETAAEAALEHHLGLACDPIGGYVQIPCIERTAMGVITASNATLLAACSDPANRKISFDEVVAAMMDIGQAMSPKIRETAQGGLAVCALCD